MTLLCACALKSVGQDVVIDDRDPQGSITHWARNIGDVETYKERKSAPYILIDTPGHLDLRRVTVIRKTIELLEESNLVVLVTQPDDNSIQGTVKMAQFIRKHLPSSNTARILFNRVRTGTKLARRDKKEIADLLKIESLDNYIPDGTFVEQVYSRGWKAVRGQKAHRECVERLVIEMLTQALNHKKD